MRSFPELGVGKYGTALKTALELRGSSALDVSMSLQPVVLVDDLTVGPGSARRWVAGAVQVLAGVGVKGGVFISCQHPEGRLAVVAPYIASGPAQSYELMVYRASNIAAVGRVYAQDTDVRRGTGTGSSGIVALDADPAFAPALSAVERITSAGQSADFHGLAVIGANDYIGVHAVTNNTTYMVGVIGWIVET